MPMTVDPMTLNFGENNLHISPYNFQMHMPIQKINGFPYNLPFQIWPFFAPLWAPKGTKTTFFYHIMHCLYKGMLYTKFG